MSPCAIVHSDPLIAFSTDELGSPFCTRLVFLLEASATPGRRRLAPTANALAGPGTRKWPAANQAFSNLWFGGPWLRPFLQFAKACAMFVSRTVRLS